MTMVYCPACQTIHVGWNHAGGLENILHPRVQRIPPFHLYDPLYTRSHPFDHMMNVIAERDAEDRASVEYLKAMANKFEDIRSRMTASMVRMEGIGQDLEVAAGPVYNETRHLQTTTQNADRMLEAINKMQSPLEGRAEDEAIIRQGPERIGVPNYLTCLRRVQGKHDQLSRSPVRVNQEAAESLSELLVFGASKLQNVFEAKLKAISRPVEPLQFITRNHPFPALNPGDRSELVELRTFLASPSASGANSSIHVQVYATVRGEYLQRSLTNLASATLTTARRQNTDDIYRQGACAIGTYARGIELSFAAEWLNICEIFGASERGRALELTTENSLAELANTLNNLNSQIKRNINTDCFLAYDIIGVVNNLAFEIDKKTGLLKQEIFGTVKPVRDTAKLSLTELLDDIHPRVNSMTYLPMDGGALNVTAQVMMRLQALTDYPAPLGSIMSSVGDGNWKSSASSISSSSVPTLKSFDVNPNTSSLLAHYVEDSIETLFRDYEAKCRTMMRGSKQVSGVFILNNYAVAERMIRSSELGALFPNGQSPKLEAWKAKGKNLALSPWDELIRDTLMDQQNTTRKGNRPSSGGALGEGVSLVKNLNSKERDNIKEKFKTFNSKFDGNCVRHRELLPAMEREVRPMLAQEIHRSLENMYKRFWDRYHEIDKGRGKYVRYDPAGLSGMLASLA